MQHGQDMYADLTQLAKFLLIACVASPFCLLAVNLVCIFPNVEYRHCSHYIGNVPFTNCVTVDIQY